MLVAYVDESYSRSFFCFAAVVADAGAIRHLSDRLDELMQVATHDFGLSPSTEIHGYPIFHGKDDWLGVGVRARIWVFERAIEAILETGVTLLLRGTDTRRLQQRQRDRGYPDVFSRERIVFQHILERIDQVAASQDTYALVIADDRDDRDAHRKHFQDYRQEGTPGVYMSSRLPRLLDTVYFAPSHPSRLLQAADVLAFTYRRWNTHRESDPRARDIMDRLRRRISTSPKLHSPGNWP